VLSSGVNGLTGSEVLIVLVTIFAASLIKTVTGQGFPALVIPVLSLFLSFQEAVIIVAAPNLLTNVWLVSSTRGEARNSRDLPVLLITGVVGTVIGTFLLVALPEKPLVVVLAATVWFYVVLSVRNPHFSIGPTTSRRWSPAVGCAGGVAQGVIGIAGPIFATWVHSFRLSRTAYVFSITTIFLCTVSAQVITLLVNGDLNGLWLITLLTILPALAAVPLGMRARDKLSGAAFDRAAFAMLIFGTSTLLVRTFA
jgi:uncharacterized membrane protein YfcA